MTDLLLQPIPTQYEVIADGKIVGQIALFTASSTGTPWLWSIDFAFHEGRHPAHGFEATREAAMQAFARCWFPENRPG